MSTRPVSSTLLLLVLLVATPLTGQARTPTSEDIHHSRGLSVSSAYQLDNVDAVNLFNGGLTISLPLGSTYPVGGGLSYGFSIHTNSNVWDFDQVNRGDGVFETVAEPDSDLSNAGLGWAFTFGRLFAPNTPGINDNPSTWLLLESDGSRRKFSNALHTWGSSATSTFSYTRDGSYLRMRKLANGEREVESPNGTIRVFRTDGWLRQIRDRFGNALNVSYDVNFLTWTLTDSTGRSHVATFEADPTDPEVILALKRKRLKTLDLAAFQNSRALYTFQYSEVFIDRPSKDSSSTTGPQVQVSLLDSITLPDTSTFQVTTIRTGADKRNVFEETGMIRSLTLPTRGKLEWEYTLYTFPQAQPGGVDEGPNPWTTGSGVASKVLFSKEGTPLGTWSYQRGGRSPSQPAPPPINGDGAFEVRSWVTDPLGHQTVNYFQNDPADFGYGQPFTKLLADATGTRFLSREIFDGTATSSSRLRSEYLRYEGDPATVAGNERIVSRRTIYHDDGNRFADVDLSDFDGHGHYRTSTTGGNFGSGDVKTTFTNYNPSRGTLGQVGYTEWSTASNWVLNTFTEQWVTEGITAKRFFCFDSDTGFLERERILRNSSPRANDVLRVYTPNGAGQRIREQHYGGDGQNIVLTSDLCNQTLPSTDRYRIDHTYQNGVLSTSQYKTSTGGSLGFFHVNRTIDRNTGLVASSTDTAGLITDFEYDALGRQTWIKPRATGGIDRDGWDEFVYVPATATNRARVDVRQRGTGAKSRPILAEGRSVFDDFGRLAEERTTLASGAKSRRITSYNALHLPTLTSEWAQVGETLQLTQITNYDPFGRARRITAPDGKDVLLE